MERLKQLLAFPLYATVAWLVWVLGAQVGNDAVMRIGIVLVLVAFALWAWRTWRGGTRRVLRGVAVLAAIAGVAVAWPLLAGGAAAQATTQPSLARADGWQAWSPDRVAALTAQGRPVFVDFTAAWCITCQVNERLVLNDARVRDAFARNDVALRSRRLDAARSRHQRGVVGARPQRRAGLRAVPQGPRAAVIARSAAATDGDRRARFLTEAVRVTCRAGWRAIGAAMACAHARPRS